MSALALPRGCSHRPWAGHKGLSLLGDSSLLLWLGVQSSLTGMQD